MENTGDTVDRTAPTKANDEVDRVGITAEPDEVDRERSTQEDESSAIIFHIHPVPPDKSPLLKDFKKNNILCCLVGQHVVFGRGEGVNVFLNDDKASRRHMELTAMIGSGQELVFKIKNVSKSLPLYVNNEILNPGGERYLMRSDVIRIGQLTFTVDINPNHAYSGTEMYNLEFQMLPAMQHTSGIPPQPAGLSYNPAVLQTFGVPQPGMPQGFIPGPHIPHASFQPPLGTVPHMPNMQTSPGFPIFPTSFHPVPQQGQFPLNTAMPNIHNNPAQFIPVAVNSGQQQFPLNTAMPNIHNNPTQFIPVAVNLSQQQGQFPLNTATPNIHNNPAQFIPGAVNSGQQQGQFPLNTATPNVMYNNPAQFIPGAVNSGQQQVHAQDRREMFQQNIAGHIPSENDDVHNGPKKSLSVEETQPPKEEETQPLKDQSSFEETQPPKQI